MADSRIDDLRRRLERDPGSRLFAQLAEELRKAGELEEAIGVARAGLALHPAYPSARLTLGRALLDSGDPRAARVEFETAVKGAPDNILANRLLGEALESLGDLKGALAQYRATLGVAPGDRNVEGRVEALEARVSGGGQGGAARGTATSVAPPPQAVRPAKAAEPEAEGVAPTIRIRAPGEPPLQAVRPATPPPPLPSRSGGVAGETPTPGARAPRPPAGASWATQPTPVVPEEREVRAVPAPPPPTEPLEVAPQSEPTGGDVSGAGAPDEATEADVAPTLPPSRVRSMVGEEDVPPSLPPSAVPGSGPGGEAIPSPSGDDAESVGPTRGAAGEPDEALAGAEPSGSAGVGIEHPPLFEATPMAEPAPMGEPAPVAEATPLEPGPVAAEEIVPSTGPSAAGGEVRRRGVDAAPTPMVEPPAVRRAEPPVPAADPSRAVEGGGESQGSPLSSVTLAELYFQQGLLERAVEVYRQVLDEEPANSRARARLAEVESLVAAAATDLPVPASSAPGDDREIRRQALVRTIELLEGLLAVVRRR